MNKHDDEFDPKYLSEEMRDQLDEAKRELTEQPITRIESIRYWFYVNICLYGKLLFLRGIRKAQQFLFNR